MNTIRKAIAFGLVSFFVQSAFSGIMINEVMQSNVYTIMDDLNEFPDSWAELYNSGLTSVSLDGYRLGVKNDFETAYELHGLSIAAGGYMLIYCDKAATGKHTDFRIDSGKGSLYLFDPSGSLIDVVNMAKQPAPDVAYGRIVDGDPEWGYQLSPSPEGGNVAGTSNVVLGDVRFSVPGGVWKNERTIELELSLPDGAPEGSYIIYTIDGSEPHLANPEAILYTGAFSFSSSRVVRAKAVCQGCITRPSNVQSYIFLGRDMQIPVVSIVVNNDYLYDWNIGIFADGPGGELNENYRHDWRRPINLEYFDTPGKPAALNQLCETRVQGGGTRYNPLKSLAIYANKRFGTKRFEYEFWPDDKPGVTDNKSFILRNGGNDFLCCYVRDALIQRMIGRNTTIDWQGYSPAIVFINGNYHGMLAVRERSNEDNIYSNYDGLENIDMVEKWRELKAGDLEAYSKFIDFIESNEEHTWQEWQDLINVESYVNLMAINYWVHNTDFPHNNTVMWRMREGDDCRWRWLVKDCDFGLGIWNNEENLNEDFFHFLNADHPGYDPTGNTLWRAAMKCPEFKQYFEDRFVAYMGDFLNAKTFSEYFDEIWAENCGEQKISHEIWIEKTGELWSNLESHIDFMRSWISRRGNNIPSLMQSSFGLGEPVEVNVNSTLSPEVASNLNLTYAGVSLTRGVFNGNDFIGRTITLEGDPSDNIEGWLVKVAGEEPMEYRQPRLVLPIKDTRALQIQAILGDNGIGDISWEATWEIEINEMGEISAARPFSVFDISGRQIASSIKTYTPDSQGIFIVKTQDGKTRKIIRK